MAGNRSYYEVLGVLPSASIPEIREAFRNLARELHPDRSRPDRRAGDEARFQEITEAYNVLSDATRRARYDRSASQVRSAGPMDPRDLARTLLLNANAAARSGDIVRARDLYEQAVAHDPRSARAHHAYGVFLMRQVDRQREGLRHLDTAVSLEPMDTRILLDASRAFAQAGMLMRAKRYGRAARELAPGEQAVEAWWLELEQRGMSR